MAKTSFKIKNLRYSSQSPVYWSICLDDVPKKDRENYLDAFADDFRQAEFSVEDFIINNI